MSDYRTIFTVSLAHDYYMSNKCYAIDICPTALGHELMRRRGLIFKRIDINQWSVIGDCAGSGVDDQSDVLQLDMMLQDKKFPLFTEWQNFRPENMYTLKLPCDKTDVESTDVIRPSDERQKHKSFCSVNLKLTNRMFENARNNISEINTLNFHSPKVYWEYILIPRHGESSQMLEIKEEYDDIKFGLMEKVEVDFSDKPVLRAITDSKISMKEHHHYDLSIIEVVSQNPLVKRTLIKRLPHPLLGAFHSDKADTIQQICYY